MGEIAMMFFALALLVAFVLLIISEDKETAIGYIGILILVTLIWIADILLEIWATLP